MEIFVTYLIFCFVIAWIAGNKGRGTGNWFVIALLLSPLVGLICVLVASDLKKENAEKAEAATRKKCPFCAEMVKEEAVVCRYCGKEL